MPSADTNNQKKNRRFLEALYRDPVSAKQLLVEDSEYIHYRSSIGETPFHYVVIENDASIAALLLEWGANVDAQDDFGDTPLIHAVELGYSEMAKWLVCRGASHELRNTNGETALSWATLNKNNEVFELLISLPRQHPIDYYYDDLSAHEVLNSRRPTFKNRLIELGLTKRYD